MSNFGQIPTHLICRFAELTKTEIIVVSFLYASRNRETNRCNPSRGAISRATGIAKPHVSTAVKSLEDKEWIFEHADGSFALTEPCQRVTKSVTPKVTESVTEGLRISTSGVTDSVIKGYENGNSHIRNLSEHKKNIEERTEEEAAHAIDDPRENEFVQAYFQIFPEDTLSVGQMESIVLRIRDPAAWLVTLCYWRDNGYRQQSIGKMCQFYDEELRGDHDKAKGNGNGKQSEREKSAQRAIDNEQLAREIAAGQHTEAVGKLFGRDGADHQQKHLTG
jgi:hypothetical protein